MTGVISLTTDFGLSDEYVGVMKGAILSIAPHAHIVDLTHSIHAQSVEHAAYILYNSYRYFPANSIHAVVVDPGVGSRRDILLLCLDGHMFLAPDNGLLSLLLAEDTDKKAYQVNNDKLFMDAVSHTFHGRDIIAPVAAHLANGLAPEQAGTACSIDTCHTLDMIWPLYDKQQSNITGKVIHIDHFGNVLTNIKPELVHSMQKKAAPDKVVISLRGKKIHGLRNYYMEADMQSPLALVGSRNLLEISVNQGNAAHYFDVRINDPVTVSLNYKN